MKYLPIVSSIALSLAAATAAVGQGTLHSQWSLIEAEQVAGRAVFQQHCAACHTRKPGVFAALGPSLKGVVGRPAGSAPGFPYSEALKKSGITWTEESLRTWITDGGHMVPGTLMPHVAITDPAEVLYVIEYLKTLEAPKKP